MKTLARDYSGLMIALTLALTAMLPCPAGASEKQHTVIKKTSETNVGIVWYPVSRKVSGFATNLDVSTPEAAFATFNRLSAGGDQTNWWRLSVPRIASQQQALPPKQPNVSRKAAYEWLNSEVVEVGIYHTNSAEVFARVPHPFRSFIEVRCFELEHGRWLNEGNSVVSSLREARQRFMRRCAARQALAAPVPSARPNKEAEVLNAAARLFDAIRKANYEHPGDWHSFPASDVKYCVHTDYPSWMRWICQQFRTNPIIALDLGEVVRQGDGRLAVPYKASLKNGASLKGVLPFDWDARGKHWYGIEGLDWHLQQGGAQ
jgi:hypothetical protein